MKKYLMREKNIRMTLAVASVFMMSTTAIAHPGHDGNHGAFWFAVMFTLITSSSLFVFFNRKKRRQSMSNGYE
ncbi:hypothetical protein [Alteromonas mediterranea]|uniref:hypothetical protein n=1 Tax=Alteromonas mediterranea TaxID=314275 RepID=UPI002FE183F2